MSTNLSSLRIVFGSAFAYHPRGTSNNSRLSQNLAQAVKQAKTEILPRAVGRVLEAHENGKFPGLFGPEVTAVPVPRSVPLVSGALWPSASICEEMLKQGLVGSVSPLLKRIKSVRPSHLQRGSGHPKVEEHIGSLEADVDFGTDRILLVDDVVTLGATFIGGYYVIRSRAAWASVCAFAVVRTTGFGAEVGEIFDPVSGSIEWKEGTNWVERNP